MKFLNGIQLINEFLQYNDSYVNVIYLFLIFELILTVYYMVVVDFLVLLLQKAFLYLINMGQG